MPRMRICAELAGSTMLLTHPQMLFKHTANVTTPISSASRTQAHLQAAHDTGHNPQHASISAAAAVLGGWSLGEEAAVAGAVVTVAVDRQLAVGTHGGGRHQRLAVHHTGIAARGGGGETMGWLSRQVPRWRCGMYLKRRRTSQVMQL